MWEKFHSIATELQIAQDKTNQQDLFLPTFVSKQFNLSVKLETRKMMRTVTTDLHTQSSQASYNGAHKGKKLIKHLIY